jgi:hypothetical protein
VLDIFCKIERYFGWVNISLFCMAAMKMRRSREIPDCNLARMWYFQTILVLASPQKLG